MKPFTWVPGATASLSCSTTSANVALPKLPNGCDFDVRFYNSGTVPVFVQFGTASSVTSSTSEVPIAPGSVEVLRAHSTAAAQITHIAAVTASGTATLYVTTGIGL